MEYEADFLSSSPLDWSSALREYFTKYEWGWDPSTNVISQIDGVGRQRSIRVGWDSNTVLRNWLAEKWRQQAYSREGRVWKPQRRGDREDDGLTATSITVPRPPPGMLPVLDSHRARRKNQVHDDNVDWQVALFWKDLSQHWTTCTILHK